MGCAEVIVFFLVGTTRKYQLAGGCKYVLFPPLLGEDSHFDEYFSNGLVQPPTSQSLCFYELFIKPVEGRTILLHLIVPENEGVCRLLLLLLLLNLFVVAGLFPHLPSHQLPGIL